MGKGGALAQGRKLDPESGGPFLHLLPPPPPPGIGKG